MLATNARRAAPVLFLKATTKKQVFVPTYTRGDGVVVEGHYAAVHVSTDFDSHKVLAGNGSASQKQAHARLARHDWFHALPHEHKAAVLLEHATDIQDKASAASALSTLRKQLVGGKPATRSQWRAFETATPDKQRELVQALRDAGKLDAVPEPYRKLEAPEPKQARPKSAVRARPKSSRGKPVAESELWKSHEQAVGEQGALFAAHKEKLAESPDAAKALRDYQGENGVYRPSVINGWLRTGHPGSNSVAQLEQARDRLDAATNHPLGDITLTRGTGFIGNLKLPTSIDEARALVGREAADPTYMSTAIGNTNFVGAGRSVVRIRAKGANGVHVFAGRDTQKVNSTVKSGQMLSEGSEVLLARNTSLRITGVTESTHPTLGTPVLVYHADVVPAAGGGWVDDHLEDIDSAKLPESNTNSRVVNGKLDAIAAALKAGDPAVLTMMSYGTNNYAKKAVELANRALELLGSSERVQPGHKGTQGFRTDAQVAAAKARAKASRTVDPERDSLFTAMAKLGGLKSSDVSKAWGLGKNDMKGYAVGIKPVFSSSKGLTIEQMAEALHELGYLQSEDHAELEKHVSNGMAGAEHFTPQGYANKAQVDYDEQYQGLTAQDAHETGFDELPPEAQDQIGEFLDENPDFTDAELESFGRALELADSDVPFDLDFGTEESRGEDFGQPHAAPRKGGDPGDDVPF